MLIAVDTGGTKTLVASFSSDGSLQTSERFETPKNTEEYITQVGETIRKVLGDEAPTAIVVAVPGTILRTGVLRGARNLGWKNFDIVSALQPQFDCPILLENDANLAGLAEAHALPETPQICLYITVSTGVGTGIITHGRISEEFGQAEGGQAVVTHDGELKTWESFASGRAFHEKYNMYAKDVTDSAQWQEIGENIGLGLVAQIPLLNPDVVVIGGSIGTYFDKYAEYLEPFLRAHLVDRTPEVRAASHPEQAVIYGCYYHALDRLASEAA
ncbi:MAG TPA: ROK family protein [Candidatus Saccharibacteria bacterium]|nr:ROK family protein [Candidatus Saccharibacteria bacterium]